MKKKLIVNAVWDNFTLVECNGKIPIMPFTNECIDYENSVRHDHPTNLGVPTGINNKQSLLGFDVDIDNKIIKENILSYIKRCFGDVVVRFSPKTDRILIPILLSDGKPFKHKVIKTEQGNIDCIGAKHQFIVSGKHPTSGGNWYYKSKTTKILTLTNSDQFDEFIEDIITVAKLDLIVKSSGHNHLIDKSIKRGNLDIDDLYIWEGCKETALHNCIRILKNSDNGSHHDARLRCGELLGGYISGKILKDSDITEVLKANDEIHKDFKDPLDIIERETTTLKTAIENGKQNPLTRVYPSSIVERKNFNKKLTDKISNIRDIVEVENLVQSIIDDDYISASLKDSARKLGSKKLSSEGVPTSPADFKAAKTIKAVENSYASMKEYFKPWVFITQLDKFYNCKTRQFVSANTLNFLSIEVGNSDDYGSNVFQARANGWLKDYDDISNVANEPNEFIEDGRLILNSYQPTTIKQVKTTHPVYKNSVNILIRHIKGLCGNRDEVYNDLIDYLAFNIQFAGEKSTKAYLISGIEGDGKSFIGTLMEALLGIGNSVVISNDMLKSEYNGFVREGSLGIIEEIGGDKSLSNVVMTRLKILIANLKLPIRIMYRDSINCSSHQNYIAFSNEIIPLKLNDGNRRWTVVRTPWGSIGKMMAYLGYKGTATEYFNELYNLVSGDELESIYTFLMNHNLTHYDARKPSLITRETLNAVDSSQEDNADSIERYIHNVRLRWGMNPTTAKLMKKFKANVVFQTELINFINEDIKLTNRPPITQVMIRTALIRLGYTRAAKRIRIDNCLQSMWTISKTNKKNREA